MKNPFPFALKTSLLPTCILALFLPLAGCATAPTAAERAIANVQTNYVPKLVLVTNTLTLWQTNLVVQTVTVTNSVGVITPVYLTNLVPVEVTHTNLVLATNMVPVYTMTPNATATGIAGVAGTIGNIAAPGTGTLITGGILGLLSIFLGYRNRQMAGNNSLLTQSAGVLAQTVETSRELMATTPQGKKVSDAFTAWMIKNQAATGVISQVSQIVKDSTDNVQAQAAASQILALIGQTSVDAPTAPVAPKA